MRIEIACEKNDTTTDKGNLLENLTAEILKKQGYEVTQNIRLTACELDLLCTHKVNGKKIYVECKAYKDKINASILKNMLGTITLKGYEEGWIISTADFGKDAKGFIEEWSLKPQAEKSKLSFYQPSAVIETLTSAGIIKDAPETKLKELLNSPSEAGAWTLIISKYGIHWAAFVIESGTPESIILFDAKTSQPILDQKLLSNIKKLDSSILNYKLYEISSVEEGKNQLPLIQKPHTSTNVIEVQTGDSWNDYRPARPKDFVGRLDHQKDILGLLSSISNQKTTTRIFSITGNSGMGKSSLIAKLRDRSKNKRYKSKFFIYAVDLRGAKNSSYISSALIKMLNQAQSLGFGDKIPLKIEDPISPLSSSAITSYLQSLKKKQQVLCLVLDQFEELYSKPDLFDIFTAAKDLMIDIAGAQENLVLGFAWKTDSTTQQDHPAYHMWHNLEDLRKSFKLDVFESGEIAKALTIFEKEANFKIKNDLRHQITAICQGYPWLLKKLCINLYESVQKGSSLDHISIELDVKRLFEADTETLTAQEMACLKLVAAKSPADWSEIIETAGVNSLNSLVNKRLIIKSGDRLNIYWDIFRDYLLTGNTPVVPFNYIPTNDFSSLIKVVKNLDKLKTISSSELSKKSGFKERTALNICSDLVMFGIAERINSELKLAKNIEESDKNFALNQLRKVFGKHSLKIDLYKKFAGQTINKNDILKILRKIISNTKFNEKTLNAYTNRLCKYLTITGFLSQSGSVWVVKDANAPIENYATLAKSRRNGGAFSALASPHGVFEALTLISNNTLTSDDMLKKGYRNALHILQKFSIVSVANGILTVNDLLINKSGNALGAIWTAAKNEPTIIHCVEQIKNNKSISPVELGKQIAVKFGLNWKDASIKRNGNAYRQWSNWIIEGESNSQIPQPPGRPGKLG